MHSYKTGTFSFGSRVNWAMQRIHWRHNLVATCGLLGRDTISRFSNKRTKFGSKGNPDKNCFSRVSKFLSAHTNYTLPRTDLISVAPFMVKNLLQTSVNFLMLLCEFWVYNFNNERKNGKIFSLSKTVLRITHSIWCKWLKFSCFHHLQFQKFVLICLH